MSSSGTAKKHSLDIKVHVHVPALENATLSVEGTLPGAPGTVDKAPKAVIPLTVQPKLVVCTLIFGRQAWRKPTVQLFISAAGGAGFDVRLIGDQPDPSLIAHLPANVQVVKVTWHELVMRLASELHQDASLFAHLQGANGYKSGDFKPLTQLLFPEVVADYDFVGVCDNDLLLSSELLTSFNSHAWDFDVSSFEANNHRSHGPLQVHRATYYRREIVPLLRGKFLYILLDVFATAECTSFDEWGWRSGAMKLAAVALCLTGFTQAADPTIFHDEHSVDTHYITADTGIVNPEGWKSAALGHGMEDFRHAAPTRTPSAQFDDETHDWTGHGNHYTISPTPPTPIHTFAPSPAPSSRPTAYPTNTPSYAPTAIPTRDLTRIILQCKDLVPVQTESTWYHMVNGVGTACTNCGVDTKKCSSCPGARRCIASKQLTEAHEAADGSGSYPVQTYTSTCSHVHCKVKVNHAGQSVTEVKHHHSERYGSMHICQQGLHKDYDAANLAAACGCECFDELAGDNDWLSGLASRHVKKVAKGSWRPQPKFLKRHTLRKKADGSNQRYQAYKWDANGNPKPVQARHNHDGSVTWLNDDGTHSTDHEIWNGEAPTGHHDIDQHLGYENQKGVTMFGYND